MLSHDNKGFEGPGALGFGAGHRRWKVLFTALLFLVFSLPVLAQGDEHGKRAPSGKKAAAEALAVKTAADGAEKTDAAGSVAGPAMAEGARHGLKHFLDIAIERNPALRAARRRWKMAEQRPVQARSLDNPVLKYTEPAREIETRLGPVDRSISLSQKLPFPGKLGLKGDIAAKEAEMARVRYQKLLRDLTAEVKKTYYELYFVDKAIELQKENDAVLEYFAEISRRNYGLDVSELDELVRAQKSAAAASLGLLRIEDMREAAAARLNTLLDRPPGAEVARTAELDPLPFDHRPEDLYDWAARYNEDVKIAGLEVEKGELERRLAGYSWRPDFRVGLTYSQIGEPPAAIPDAGDDALVVTLGMSIPLWFSKNRAAVDEKGFALEGRLAERSAVVTEVVNRVKRTYFDMRTSRMVMDLYGKRLIPEAKKSVDFAEARYKTGREMLARLLEAQSMWINFRLVYFRAVADYYKSIAELERLTGRELAD